MRGQIYIPILLIIILLGISLAGGFVGLPKPKYYSPTSADAGGSVDMAFYIQNWKFQAPSKITPLTQDEISKLKRMVPYAIKGAAAYDSRYNSNVTPQLIVWWSYVEGILGAVSYSNCNGEKSVADEFKIIENCNHPSSWQLGYGIQFTALPGLLRNAFVDLHSTDSPAAVGQGVLNIDQNNGTTPHCGNFSCTYPLDNIDEIVSGINTSSQTNGNWWASVIARDPAINAYINAGALTPEGLPWSGWMTCDKGYCKDVLSNKLAAILQAWPLLLQ